MGLSSHSQCIHLGDIVLVAVSQLWPKTSLPVSAGMEGGVATCGLGELSGGGVDSPVMEEDPEEEGSGESTIIHLHNPF